jgi:hypothetical protein
MDEVVTFAARHSLAIVEDTAQSHGARWKGKCTGTFGEFGSFSFYPGKNLGAYGDGGAVCTSSDELNSKVRRLRNYGSEIKYEHPERGSNSRLDGVQAAILDVHAEATSEKMAMGHWCDGQASLVVGTHTHVPTADHMILPGGTAYLTDAGMCGDYNSVIGMEKMEPLRRFITGMSQARFEPASGPATLSGVYVETDDRTGKATRIVPVRQGGRLEPVGP